MQSGRIWRRGERVHGFWQNNNLCSIESLDIFSKFNHRKFDEDRSIAGGGNMHVTTIRELYRTEEFDHARTLEEPFVRQ